MIRVKNYISIIGGLAFVLGLAGLAGAAEGEGSFMVAAVVFSIGFGMCLLGFKK